MSKNSDHLTPLAKAHRVNLDPERYGAFAEIGAGQEVARYFFQAGKASQTIAKTISAYDMVYSDEIYGKEKNGRYVCESRLLKMLEKEFSLLIRRLQNLRGEKTKFFTFANTVATGSAETPKCHGWMGVRFQSKVSGEFNDIILHVRMMDRHRLQQQEALGVLGVNLIYAAFYKLDKPKEFIPSLVENLKAGQIVIDILKFSGPDLKEFDNPSMNIELVERGLAEAVLFDPQMNIVNIADAVYGKSVLVQRGHYRPMTATHWDVQQKGVAQLKNELKSANNKSEVLSLCEIALTDRDSVSSKLKIDAKDLLLRVECLAQVGMNILVSQFSLYYQMKSFFRRFTQNQLAIVVPASHLDKLFQEEPYKHLEGGIFEGLGKLLDHDSRIYVYPHKTEKICLTAKTFNPDKKMSHLYQHFLEQKQIIDISGCDETDIYYHSQDVLKLIEKKDKSWETLVIPGVRDFIKKNKNWPVG